jgi:hypothetical protein
VLQTCSCTACTLSSVAAHSISATHPGGAGPSARAAVLPVVHHVDAPPAAAQLSEQAPRPAPAAVAPAGEHVGARAAAALEAPARRRRRSARPGVVGAARVALHSPAGHDRCEEPAAAGGRPGVPAAGVSGIDAQARCRRDGEDYDEEHGARPCREKAGRPGCAVSHSGLDVSLPFLLLYTLTEIEWPSTWLTIYAESKRCPYVYVHIQNQSDVMDSLLAKQL